MYREMNKLQIEINKHTNQHRTVRCEPVVGHIACINRVACAPTATQGEKSHNDSVCQTWPPVEITPKA